MGREKAWHAMRSEICNLPAAPVRSSLAPPKWGENSPKNSRIEPMNQCRPSVVPLPGYGNNFSLSPGERAGVRASVLQTNSKCADVWNIHWPLSVESSGVHGEGRGEVLHFTISSKLLKSQTGQLSRCAP